MNPSRLTAEKSHSVFRSDVLPFFALFVGLIVTTIAVDGVLHLLDLAWVGRYAGIPGTLLILLALGYSLRKRKVITWGAPRRWLRNHEWLTWVGALLILVHGGIHLHAALPWYALGAMLIVVASGLIGKFLLARARQRLEVRRKTINGDDSSPSSANLFWDEVAVDAMRKWRIVHLPIALGFAVLALGHILSILMFWGWH